MGTNECSQPASKSSWDSQDFGDVNMVLKMVHFHKSSRPQWVKQNFRKIEINRNEIVEKILVSTYLNARERAVNYLAAFNMNTRVCSLKVSR